MTGETAASRRPDAAGEIREDRRPDAAGDPDIGRLFDHAAQLAAGGRTADAGLLLATLLASRPDHGPALHLAGILAFRAGDPATARDRLAAARAADPDRPGPHIDLAAVLEAGGQDRQAAAIYDQALARLPGLAELWLRRGRLRCRCGGDALADLLRAGRIDPATLTTAAELLAESLARHGLHRQQQGDTAGAARAYHAAIRLSPGSALPYGNLGLIRQGQGDAAAADRLWRHALRLEPQRPELHLNRGGLARDCGEIAGALAHARCAVMLAPGDARAWNNLANARRDAGDAAAAAAGYRRALRLVPAYRDAHSNLLLCLIALPDISAPALAAEHAAWARRHAPAPAAPRPAVSRHPGPLRVGLVSADFRAHSCAWFLEPLLRGRNPAELALTCYAQVPAPDPVTARLRTLADGWRDITGRDDAALAALMADDGIDVAVDLSGHTAGNRLTAFARRLAPLQISWLGYAAGTGIAAIDARLTDAVADPPGLAEQQQAERLLRLPGGFLCFGPSATAPAPRPRRPGPPRFGSFNALSKLNPAVIACWAALVAAIPGASLRLKARGLESAPVRDDIARRFAAAGLPPAQLDLCGWRPGGDDHLALYQDIDIALDPFPYSGTTTTCEALWQGVPVITLAGDRHAGRVGASLLHRLDLPGLVAATPAGFAAIATGLAADQQQLAELRATLRPRMAASPLCDADRFSREFTAALVTASATITAE